MNGRSSEPSYLRVSGVTKRFGDFVALKNVSLSVAEGEFVCILGPSGCGKTTLFRIIAGLEQQTEGRIEQGGRDISALPVARRDFGIVFQSYALFPNLTVTDNVAYGLSRRTLGRAGVAARVAELLEMVGLPAIGGRYPAQLSGGQQQRVALARALTSKKGLKCHHCKLLQYSPSPHHHHKARCVWWIPHHIFFPMQPGVYNDHLQPITP